MDRTTTVALLEAGAKLADKLLADDTDHDLDAQIDRLERDLAEGEQDHRDFTSDQRPS